MSDSDFRFGGIARLYGRAGLERLRRSRVMVIGIGGVGSWAAEAIARSAVGSIILVDLDEVCVSNINRQLPAQNATLGQPKVEVMAARIRDLNPDCTVDARMEFFTESTAESLLALTPDFVIDAIDAVSNKCRLIAGCHARRIPVICCGGAGGRRDPTQVRVTDLARVTHDRLLGEVRKRLRQEFGFPRGEKNFGIEAVCSAEVPVFPAADGTVCAQPDPVARSADSETPNAGPRLNCDWGYGSSTPVTGTFGFAAAGWVIRRIAESEPSLQPRTPSP
jgi:tRNA A37 threonylcarbamoyladenosine dehydratase